MTKAVFRTVASVMCAVLCICILFSGCSGSDAVNEDKLVVTSFYPVYIFTLNLVEGTDITVNNLTEQKVGCLHDYRLLTGDVKKLADAELFVMCGAGMETFLEDLLRQLPQLKTVDSSVGASLLYADEGAASHFASANSHIWMSVKNAQVQVNNIRDALVREFPENADTVNANCVAYTQRLEALYNELMTAALPIEGTPIITFHEAYDYMARELSLNIVGSIESDEGGEPTAKELGELTELIRSSGVNALYTEPNYAGSAAGILSAETGVPEYVLNPVTSGDGSLTSYEDILKNNIKIMTEMSVTSGD